MIPEASIPFIGTALLTGVGAVSSFCVSKRSPGLVRELNAPYEDRKELEGRVPDHLSPEGVGRISTWAADCAQSLVALIGPSFAALWLVDDQTLLVRLAYIVVILLGLIVFAALLFTEPSRYAHRVRYGITPLIAGAVMVSLVLATIVGLASS